MVDYRLGHRDGLGGAGGPHSGVDASPGHDGHVRHPDADAARGGARPGVQLYAAGARVQTARGLSEAQPDGTTHPTSRLAGD